jgi:hypothetical protein
LLGWGEVKTFVVMTALVGSLAVASPARAEDVVAYQADGDADASAPDARIGSLDDAFARAISQAVNELVEPEVRRQRKPVIDRELIGHARLWVTGYKVTREAVSDGRLQVSLSVRVDRDKLRARLAELNIAVREAGEAPPAAAQGSAQSAAQGSAQSAAQSVIVLLRVAAPDGVHASYGLAAEKEVAGLAALSDVLRRASFAIKRAPASGPAARADGELPLDDDTAEALAAEARTDLAVIGGVVVGAPVPLRGVAASSALVTARLRLIDRKAHRLIGQGAAVVASRGSDPGEVGYAIDRALLAAAADAVPQPAQGAQGLGPAQAFIGDDTPVVEPGVVLVRLARTTSWSMVQAELKHLVGARGVSHATLRRVSPAGWVIGVTTTDSIDRIASIVKKPPAADTTVSVKIAGDLIEAALSGAP